MMRASALALLALLLAACNSGSDTSGTVSADEQRVIDKANADVTAALAEATDDSEGRQPTR
jgi:hypothetical protein